MSFFSDLLGLLKFRKEKQKVELEIKKLKDEAQKRKSLIHELTPEERETLIEKPAREEIIIGKYNQHEALYRGSGCLMLLFVLVLAIIIYLLIRFIF